MLKIAHRVRATEAVVPHPAGFWVAFPLVIACLTLVLAFAHPSMSLQTEVGQVLIMTAP